MLSIHETNMKLSTCICKSHLLLCHIRNLQLTLVHKAKTAGFFSLLEKDKAKQKVKLLCKSNLKHYLSYCYLCPVVHLIRRLPVSVIVTKWKVSLHLSRILHHHFWQEMRTIKGIKSPPNPSSRGHKQ